MSGPTTSPRIAFVVHQYGPGLGGGLERHCQLVAERMRQHWDIEILTTCSRDFATWANYYPPGVLDLDGVRVRRFPVERERDPEFFRTLCDRVLGGAPTREQEEEWLRAQGPDAPALLDYIRSHVDDFDLFVFFGYLYGTTSFGISIARGKSVLVPAAHDEPMIRLSVYRDVFRAADLILFSTPEERRLVESIVGGSIRSEVCGVGFDAPKPVADIELEIPQPYLIYVGRVDEPKGCGELTGFFANRPADLSRLNLCLVGHKRMEIPPVGGLFWLGYLGDEEKSLLMSKALCLVMPSFYESLSLVLLESWACGTPVIANGRCAVLAGQCERSGGGLTYDDADSFYEAVRSFYHSPALRHRCSVLGARYARRVYSWDRVEAAYLKALEQVTGGRRPAKAIGNPRQTLSETCDGKVDSPAQPKAAKVVGSRSAPRPKLAFVVPWYGMDIPGGAETLCREWVERLAGAGYEVEVLTTTIREFQSNWNEAHHRAGEYREGRALVRRFDLRRGDHQRFNDVNRKLLAGAPIDAGEELVFLTEGPNSEALLEFIRRHRDEYCFFFIPYLFGTTYWGARAAGSNAFLIPCLHDEAYARLPRLRQLFSDVRGIVFNSRPEEALARRLYALSDIHTVVLGMGLDDRLSYDPEAFRAKFSQQHPFILCAGRKDATKNTDLLLDYFKAYKRSRPDSNLQLLFIGPGQLPAAEGVRDLGFLSRQDKLNAYSAASLLCSPSVNESLSIVLMESWLCGAPVAVHANCEVTRNHVESSGGGIYFSDYYEWEAGVSYLLGRPEVRARMAAAGAAFVRANYSWEVLLSSFSNWLDRALER